MTEPEDPEKNERPRWLKAVPVGCLISLGTLALVFFFIVEICSRN